MPRHTYIHIYIFIYILTHLHFCWVQPPVSYTPQAFMHAYIHIHIPTHEQTKQTYILGWTGQSPASCSLPQPEVGWYRPCHHRGGATCGAAFQLGWLLLKCQLPWDSATCWEAEPVFLRHSWIATSLAGADRMAPGIKWTGGPSPL